MNAEHTALAEYLESRFYKRFDEINQKLDRQHKAQSQDIFRYMDRRFDEVRNEFKEVHRRITNQIDFVDRKNEEQDEQIEIHEFRIRDLESDHQIMLNQGV